MKKYYSLFLLGIGLLSSCHDDNLPAISDSIQIRTDSEVLSQRINREGSGVVSLVDPSLPAGRINEDEISASELPLVLISQVEAPQIDGQTLQATHVDIDGDYAYVSYNTVGETYLGGVEIFNIQDVFNPQIVSQAIFRDIDISSLVYENGTLYLAAAVNIDADFPVTSPANLISVSVSGGQFISDFSFVSFPGYVATDVARTPSHSVITTGNPGIAGLVDNSLTVGQTREIADLRSVAYGSNKLAVLSGTEGILILNPETLETEISIPLSLESSGAKRTLEINEEILVVAEGQDGAGIYQIQDGSSSGKIAIPINPEDVSQGEIVTNAVSLDEDILFMANGAAGISISDISDSNNIKNLGILDLNGSSNFVKNEQKYVFVASGNQGLQLLKIQTEEAEGQNESFVECEGLSAYTGSQNLNVNSNETQAYAGSIALKNVNIGGTFLYCGSLAIEQNLNINSNGLMTVNGSFVFGQYQKNTSLNINSQSKLQLQGSTVIYGDLRLNSGATLEFLGTGNTLTVYGTVTINSGAQIIGDFTDTEGKIN